MAILKFAKWHVQAIRNLAEKHAFKTIYEKHNYSEGTTHSDAKVRFNDEPTGPEAQVIVFSNEIMFFKITKGQIILNSKETVDLNDKKQFINKELLRDVQKAFLEYAPKHTS